MATDKPNLHQRVVCGSNINEIISKMTMRSDHFTFLIETRTSTSFLNVLTDEKQPDFTNYFS